MLLGGAGAKDSACRQTFTYPFAHALTPYFCWDGKVAVAIGLGDAPIRLVEEPVAQRPHEGLPLLFLSSASHSECDVPSNPADKFATGEAVMHALSFLLHPRVPVVGPYALLLFARPLCELVNPSA